MHLHPIDMPPPGRLAIALRPRGGPWLQDDLRAARRAGVDLLISMLEPAEARELELEDEARLCQAAGLHFIALPIPDRGLPASTVRFAAALAPLSAALDAGQSLAVHCRAGIGRSTLLAGSLLVRRGLQPEDAWTRLATARGRPVPDTEEQRRWLITSAPRLR